MGAQNIDFNIAKKVTEKQILKEFKSQQKFDRSYNGHQDGYSGDFNTVSEVKMHLSEVFNCYNDAQAYCLDNAEKWTSVVAVYYLRNAPKPSSKLAKLLVKKNDIELQIEIESKAINDKAKRIGKNLGTLVAGWGAC